MDELVLKEHADVRPEAKLSPRAPMRRRGPAPLSPISSIDRSDPLAEYRKRYLLSVTETADLLGLSPHLVRACIRRKDPLFPVVRIGRRVLIQRAGVFAAFGLD